MGPRQQTFEFTGVGVRLVAETWGDRDAPGPLVMLHGGGQTRHSWDRTAQRLAAAGWYVVTYDARGHGDSDWDAGGNYRLDAFVGDLLALVEILGRAPVLIGASLGGMTALVAAGEHARLAQGLVLVDVVIELNAPGRTRIMDFLTAHGDGFGSLEEVAEAIVAYNPTRRRPRNLEGLRKNVRQRADGRWYWHWDPAFVEITDEPQRRADPARFRAAAMKLTIPTLLVRGAQSDVVTDAGITDMLRVVPTATSVLVEGAGHMVAGDDNDVFVAGLETFLASFPPA